MLSKDTIKERERCRDLVISKIKRVIEWRLSKKKKRFIFVLKKLSDDLVFLIDNPNHKPLKERKTPVPPKKEKV